MPAAKSDLLSKHCQACKPGTPALTSKNFWNYAEFANLEQLRDEITPSNRCILAVFHYGNFEWLSPIQWHTAFHRREPRSATATSLVATRAKTSAHHRQNAHTRNGTVGGADQACHIAADGGHEKAASQNQGN